MNFSEFLAHYKTTEIAFPLLNYLKAHSESPLKIMKDTLYFTLKALFVLLGFLVMHKNSLI